jgi:hypothetical protein
LAYSLSSGAKKDDDDAVEDEHEDEEEAGAMAAMQEKEEKELVEAIRRSVSQESDYRHVIDYNCILFWRFCICIFNDNCFLCFVLTAKLSPKV